MMSVIIGNGSVHAEANNPPIETCKMTDPIIMWVNGLNVRYAE